MDIKAKDATRVMDAVLARARTMKKFDGQVYNAGVSQGDNIHADLAGYIIPYLVVSFSPFDEGPYGSRGIVTSRANSKYLVVTFQVVSSTSDLSVRLMQEVRDLFEGYEIEGCSQMVEAAGVGFAVPGEATMKPKRFGVATMFSLVVD